MKQEEEDKWIKALRNSLEDYSEPPLAGGWEKLQKELSPAPVAPKKRSYLLYYTAAAAAILLISISTAIIMTLGDSSEKFMSNVHFPEEMKQPNDKQSLKDVVAPVIKEEKTENNLAYDKSDQSTVRSNKAVSGRKSAIKNSLYAPASGSVSDKKESKAENEVKVTVTDRKDNVQLQENKPDTKTDKRNEGTSKKEPLKKSYGSSSRQKVQNNYGSEDLLAEFYEKPSRRHKKGVSLGFATGNSSGIDASGNGKDFMLASDCLSAPGNYMYYSNALVNAVMTNLNWNHKQPVSFGLSVRKQLSGSFALESGVVYTRLESVASMEGYVNKEQTLHYVGIPFKASYLFLDRRYVTLYVSGGGMVEKSVSGKLKVTDHTLNTEKTEDINIKPLQWSLNGAFGVQYNVTGQFGIFVEPGVVYYFKDGSDVETIRKKSPFNLNLQLGLRVSY